MKRIRTGTTAIESEIQAKGLTAPRVTPARIAEVIASETYFTASDGCRGAPGGCNPLLDEYVTYSTSPLSLLTFCVLELRNGFLVTGESACASPENFDAEIGRKIARENAVNKIWALEGYLLKDRLSNTPPPVDNDHVAPGAEQFSEEAIAANKK